MVDETKDVSKKEQMSMVSRYYYRGTVRESLLHIEVAQHLDAAALTEKIIQKLQHYGLDYKNDLVGQAYDGVSVMSGKNSGVQARIRKEAPLAFYVHCTAHCLNLVLVDTVKTAPDAHCFFSLLQKLYVFISVQVQVQVQVELYCHSAACGDIQWNEMSCLTGPRCYINTDIQHYKPIHKLTY